MSAAELLYTFSGRIECRRAASGPLGLTLSGPVGGEVVHLAFRGRPPPELPAELEGGELRRASPERYLLSSGGRAWEISAAAVHVHRDVGAAFYAAVPPRRVPWPKRLLLGLVLALAARPLGRRLLMRLRRALR
jgi:hypothetical protein